MLRLIDVAYIVHISNVACTGHIGSRSIQDSATSPEQETFNGKEDSGTGDDYKATRYWTAMTTRFDRIRTRRATHHQPHSTKEHTLTQKLTSRLASTGANTFTKQRMKLAARTLVPFLVAAAVTTAAHAQGTVDLSGVTTAMTTVEKTVQLGGAIALIISIVFAVFQFMGRNIAQGFIGIGGALLAGIVIGFGPGWVASLTGQSVSMIILHATGVLA